MKSADSQTPAAVTAPSLSSPAFTHAERRKLGSRVRSRRRCFASMTNTTTCCAPSTTVRPNNNGAPHRQHCARQPCEGRLSPREPVLRLLGV
jgi:hypothetical protein